MAPNGDYHVCPFCRKPQYCLPVHLRRYCMKMDTEAARSVVIDEAKIKTAEFLRTGRFFDYNQLASIIECPDTLKSFIDELKRRSLVVRGEPCPQSNEAGDLVDQADLGDQEETSDESCDFQEYYQDDTDQNYSTAVKKTSAGPSGHYAGLEDPVNVPKDFQKRLGSRWRKKQFNLRVEHTRAHFSRRLPTNDHLKSWLKRQGWKRTDDILEEVLTNWAPSGSEDRLQDSKEIQDH
ncbi:unnamed protein product [Knipowitschia caucasica]|uniref:Uncharacterized protein n=1 Tax=Knipowitschia caucasica TaxID=637954 RepID=A0AAV2IXW5_KNICA